MAANNYHTQLSDRHNILNQIANENNIINKMANYLPTPISNPNPEIQIDISDSINSDVDVGKINNNLRHLLNSKQPPVQTSTNPEQVVSKTTVVEINHDDRSVPLKANLADTTNPPANVPVVTNTSNRQPTPIPDVATAPQRRRTTAPTQRRNPLPPAPPKNNIILKYIVFPLVLMIVFILLVHPKTSSLLDKYIPPITKTTGILIRAVILGLVCIGGRLVFG